MIRISIYIDKYNWKLTIFVGVGVEHITKIVRCLHHLYCDSTYSNDAIKSIYSGDNSAITISNLIINKSVVIINKTTSDKEFVNSIVHECRHVQSHIATKYNLDEKGEDVAYLLGNIVSDVYCRLSM